MGTEKKQEKTKNSIWKHLFGEDLASLFWLNQSYGYPIWVFFDALKSLENYLQIVFLCSISDSDPITVKIGLEVGDEILDEIEYFIFAFQICG